MSAWLDGRKVLVTGGTGSFGRAFIRRLLDEHDPQRVVIYSRDELKQYDTRQHFDDDPRLRFFLGDVRDAARLRRASQDIEVMVHAAALKQVDTAEYNPYEVVKTNILGSQNVIDVAIDLGVQRVIALSTDKASSPINLYGATKLCADKLFIAGNHYAGGGPTRFSVVRYGNVLGSRGSVVPLFQRLADEGGPIPITDHRMTRFWITLDEAVQFVVDSFDRMTGGELFVPRIPSMHIGDLARAIAPDAELVEVGIRPGEKLHEEMVSEADSLRTLIYDDHYVIAPVVADWGSWEPAPGGTPMEPGVAYRSDTNDRWLDVEELRSLLGGVHADRRSGPGLSG